MEFNLTCHCNNFIFVSFLKRDIHKIENPAMENESYLLSDQTNNSENFGYY